MDGGDAIQGTCPRLSELLTFRRESTGGGVPCLYGHLPTGSSDVAALSLACSIARRRLPNARLVEAWHRRATGQTDGSPTDVDRTVIEAALLENVGTPAAPASGEHLRGLVAEALWMDVVADEDVGLGTPVRVEGHDWSVTDPGGDGLTVYVVDGDFCYRLWESKYHGHDGALRETINTACRQVEARALSYLARFSLVAQYLTDDAALATFYGRLAELWADRSSAAGVGIVVGSSTSSNQDGCFDGIEGYFNLAAEQHQGHLNLVGDFPAFAELVRRVLWKGCGPWNEP